MDAIREEVRASLRDRSADLVMKAGSSCPRTARAPSAHSVTAIETAAAALEPGGLAMLWMRALPHPDGGYSPIADQNFDSGGEPRFDMDKIEHATALPSADVGSKVTPQPTASTPTSTVNFRATQQYALERAGVDYFRQLTAGAPPCGERMFDPPSISPNMRFPNAHAVTNFRDCLYGLWRYLEPI